MIIGTTLVHYFSFQKGHKNAGSSFFFPKNKKKECEERPKWFAMIVIMYAFMHGLYQLLLLSISKVGQFSYYGYRIIFDYSIQDVPFSDMKK